MKIANMKVRTRLGLGFALVLTLLVAITALGVFRMAQIQHRLERIVQVNNAQMKLLGGMYDSVSNRMMAVRDLALLTDAAKVNDEITQIGEMEQAYAKARTALGRMIDGEERAAEQKKALLAKINAAQAEGAPLFEQAMTLAQAQNAAEATKLLFEQTLAVQSRWLGALNELIDLNDSLSTADGEEATHEYQNARLTLLLLGGAALLIGAGAAFVIVTSLLKQLGGEPRTAVKIADRIAVGDLTVEVRTAPGDQASLMHALKGMRDALATIVGQVRSGTDTISTAASEIAAGNQDLSGRTEQLLALA